MKKLLLLSIALFSFGVASAQTTQKTPEQQKSKMNQSGTSLNKDTTDTAHKKTNKTRTAGKRTKTAKSANTPVNSNDVNYPSSPMGTENPESVKTSPGSTASPTGTNPATNPQK